MDDGQHMDLLYRDRRAGPKQLEGARIYRSFAKLIGKHTNVSNLLVNRKFVILATG